MSSVPDGRAANQPPREVTLTPPIGALLPGALVRICSIGSPASSVMRTCCRSSLAELLLSALASPGASTRSAKRRAEILCQRAVVLAGISAGARGDLRRQQRRHDAVLVGGPHAAVDAAERGAGAFLAAESQVPVEQSRDEPFEAHRHLVHVALEPAADPIDHRAAHHGLADRSIRTPAAAMAKKIIDGHRQDSDWAASIRCWR